MSVVVKPPIEECVNCRHCGTLIFHLPYSGGRRKWVHRSIETHEPFPDTLQFTMGMIGCRAASFIDGEGWNKTVDERKNATPPVGWKPDA